MIRIAFVTCSEIPALTADDQVGAEALRQRGIEVDAVRWDDPAVQWAGYDTVVLRSTWDYHLRPWEFRSWIEACLSARVRLWNPGQLVLWNMDKAYLRDLAARGVAIPPCVWIDRGGQLDLAKAMEERGWDRAVLKPTISASAHQTHAVTRDNASRLQSVLPGVVRNSSAMLQQFVPQIEKQGEWSLVFFGREFSHAVMKRPKPGDFRVQHEHGGDAVVAQPAPAFLAQAQRLLHSISEPTLYTRVDACEDNGRLLLMELELIEPDLFLRVAPEAPGRFAAAIVARALK